MSALHRNALLPDALACLRCGEPVRGADDYCPACDATAFALDPVTIEAPRWLGWLAGIGFIVMLVVLVMAP